MYTFYALNHMITYSADNTPTNRDVNRNYSKSRTCTDNPIAIHYTKMK